MDIITSLNVPCSHYHIADKLLIKRVINFALKKRQSAFVWETLTFYFIFIFVLSLIWTFFQLPIAQNHEEW